MMEVMGSGYVSNEKWDTCFTSPSEENLSRQAYDNDLSGNESHTLVYPSTFVYHTRTNQHRNQSS